MRAVKWVAIGLAGVVGVAVVAVLAFLLLFPWNHARGYLAQKASDALHREVRIDGDLRVTIGNPIRIHVERIRVANVDWSDEKTMAELQELDAQLLPWPLLRGNWHFTEVRLVGPKLILEENQEGAPNWDFGPANATKAAVQQAAPKNRHQVPTFDRLAIEQGHLRFRDPRNDIDIQSDVNTATGKNDQDVVNLQGQGSFAGKPFTLKIQGGSLLTLRDSAQPYPIKTEAAIGDTHGKIEGTVADPVKLEGVDLTVDLEGQDLAEIFPIVGIPTPPTAPYSLSGRLGREGDVWSMHGMKGRVGDSDLAGDINLQVGGDRPKVEGKLSSQHLAAADLAGFVGASPLGENYATKAPGRIFPAEPINLKHLRATDLDVTFEGQQVDAPFVPLKDLKTRFKLDNGRVTADPLSVNLAGGTLAGRVVLDGRSDAPGFNTDLTFRRVQLAEFFRNTRFAKEMGGTGSGIVQLSGHGNTMADILASADGKIAAAVDGGRVSSLIVAALKTNVVQTLGIALTGSQPLAFNCLVSDFAVQKGVMKSTVLVFDTPDTVVNGEASVDLRNETVDATIAGHPKHPEIFVTHVPVHIQGHLMHPDISVNATESAARVGAAAALAVVLTPLAALLPLLDPGSTAPPTACAQLIGQAQKPAKK